jgi:chromosome partitioning protein
MRYTLWRGNMYKIAFHVEKGGTGKTTVLGNIGYNLSLFKKTLLVDCDPQGNLTAWFITNPMQHELADILQEKINIENAMQKINPNLFLIPTFGIDGSLKDWSETKLMNQPYIFSDFINTLDKDYDFDFVLFDLGPGISNLEKSILSLMDEIIGVIAAEYFSIDGLEIFENELAKLKKNRRAAFIHNKLIVNKIDSRYSLHKEYLKNVSTLNYEIFQISQNTHISSCLPFHKSIFEYDKSNINIAEFNKITNFIIANSEREESNNGIEKSFVTTSNK